MCRFIAFSLKKKQTKLYDSAKTQEMHSMTNTVPVIVRIVNTTVLKEKEHVKHNLCYQNLQGKEFTNGTNTGHFSPDIEQSE